MEFSELNSPPIHIVSSTDSPQFNNLKSSLTRSSLVGLDAEWKPVRQHQSTFPTVTLLQIACRVDSDSVVFLLDLLAIPLISIHELLKQVFESPRILKLGFKFKQDLLYLSSTFVSQGCDPGFNKVEPYIDIATIYSALQYKQTGKPSKSLAAICKDVLDVSLSKEQQCSDWSCRPLTEEQIRYAAADAHCLLMIFDVLRCKFCEEGNSLYGVAETNPYNNLNLGLKLIFEEPDTCNIIIKTKFCNALEMVQATSTEFSRKIITIKDSDLNWPSQSHQAIDDTILQIVRIYGDKILLKLSDRKPKASKRKGKRQSSNGLKNTKNGLEEIDEWEGPPPWDLSLGGDGCPKFLCDRMIEGLAKQLRCIGIDAAVPYTKKPDSRTLIEQAEKEKRVLLTRDAKLLRHDYLIKNQIYRLKNLLKKDQLVEVIGTFQLNISEDQLMSRCTKCNGRFIKRPLSIEEAIEVAKGFQVIPDCVFNKNVEFWQCKDCNHLYWEGNQYHRALQKYSDYAS
ncbi:3'-5' exonuclease domain-containing protein [Heracleum sosnowskyi]|uniref:3'-5' exonuclease domain-containing protein n=1 Tax=Heracleum sosnowskyi TaxID=360622 RepID=A0AAD8JAC5_9APIA|nr:3'-5' exonuclease domain-containing protein [Heracleum sosnowskyi]